MIEDLILDQVENDIKIQDDKKSTYTKLLTKQDGYIEVEKLRTKSEEEAEKLFNKFRGLYPWPGLWTEIVVNGEKKRLKITDMDLSPHQRGGFGVGIKKVQLEGKKEVDFKQFSETYMVF